MFPAAPDMSRVMRNSFTVISGQFMLLYSVVLNGAIRISF